LSPRGPKANWKLKVTLTSTKHPTWPAINNLQLTAIKCIL
jgi:hypothetical protein